MTFLISQSFSAYLYPSGLANPLHKGWRREATTASAIKKDQAEVRKVIRTAWPGEVQQLEDVSL